MAKHPRVNWPQVRAAYIEGHIIDPQRDAFTRAWPTLEEVAALHGIHHGTVEVRAAREKWLDQRQTFQTDVEQARRRWLVENRTERVSRIDDRGLSDAEAGLALVGMRLTHLLHAEQSQPETQRGRAVDARELSALGLAGKRFLDMKAQIMGQPLTAGEQTVDELERQARVEELKLAEELVAFIAERQAELEADELAEVG
jgi:hypothetical protein